MATDPRRLLASREWWARNAAARAEIRRAAYAADPEAIKKKARDRYHENKEQCLAKVRAHREANPELIRQQHREHYARNADARKASSHGQRAKRREAPGTHTAEDIRRLKALQKNKCAVCRCALMKFHIDHITPLSRGGSNDATNLQLLCQPCNQTKADKDPVLFMQQRGYLI